MRKPLNSPGSPAQWPAGSTTSGENNVPEHRTAGVPSMYMMMSTAHGYTNARRRPAGFRAVQRPCPYLRVPGPSPSFHRRFEALVHLPLPRDVLPTLPVSDGESVEIRSAERCRLGHLRPHDGDIE